MRIIVNVTDFSAHHTEITDTGLFGLHVIGLFPVEHFLKASLGGALKVIQYSSSSNRELNSVKLSRLTLSSESARGNSKARNTYSILLTDIVKGNSYHSELGVQITRTQLFAQRSFATELSTRFRWHVRRDFPHDSIRYSDDAAGHYHANAVEGSGLPN